MKRSLSLSGIPVSPGIAVGRAAVWLVRADSSPRRDLDSEEVPTELERLRLAVESAIREIGEMAGQVEERLGKEYAAIFQAHALFLRDPSFLGPIEKKIRVERVNAEWAVEVVADALAARLRDLPDQDLALRASDLDDVAAILRRSLGEGEAAVDRLASLTGDSCVLVADELTPSDAVRIPRDKVVAFVTERGGKTSHAAILARSFGLPAVVAIPKLLASIGDGDRLIVDGREGVVWREPSEDVLALFQERQGRDATRERSLKERSLSGLTRTRDGQEVSIRANIELAREVPDVFEYGADGVGLFRSEFLYLSGAGMEFPGRGHPGGHLPGRRLAARAPARRHPDLRPRGQEGGPPPLGRRGEPRPRPARGPSLLQPPRDVPDPAPRAAVGRLRRGSQNPRSDGGRSRGRSQGERRSSRKPGRSSSSAVSRSHTAFRSEP